MPHEEIFEPIQVISFFQNGQLHPLRFKWKNRVYKIIRVNSSWSSQLGTGKRYHFSVISDTPDCFELIFDSSTFFWELARVYVEG